MSDPYDPLNPDMPPLINDVICDWEKFNAEAEAVKKVAEEIGFTSIIQISWPPERPEDGHG